MQKSYDVYLGGEWIDTVYVTGCSAEEVRESLVNHDGYNPGIKVVERG